MRSKSLVTVGVERERLLKTIFSHFYRFKADKDTMYRSTMIRTLARATVQPSLRTLAHSQTLLGQRLTTPIRQPQQLRSFSVLNAVPYFGRRRVDRGLKGTLDRALSIEDPEQKQQVFFDVARRFAANNGGSGGLEFKSPGATVPLSGNRRVAEHLQLDQRRHANCQCSVKAVGSHNMQYAIDMAEPRRWKVWVAVNAELRPPKGSGSRTISAQEAVDAGLVSAVVLIVVHACAGFQKQLAAVTKEAADGKPGVVSQVPDEIDLELLAWDTVIPLEVETRKWSHSTYWVEKLGERRPWKNTWFPVIIPIAFFDF